MAAQEPLPGMPEPQAKRPRERAPKSKGWSGPIPGQQVMHQTDLGRRSIGVTAQEYHRTGQDIPKMRYQSADPHGFMQQPMTAWAPETDQRTQDLYAQHGGALHDVPRVRDFWQQKPVHQVRSDTPLHSTQSWEATEGEKPGSITQIQHELEHGGALKAPSWLVKDQGRLFVLDGHHRIAAARRAGKETFPAHVWDRDAETGWKPN